MSRSRLHAVGVTVACCVAFAGCGSVKVITVTRPTRPVYDVGIACERDVPKTVCGADFDLRGLLGRTLADARHLAAAHHVTLQVKRADGRPRGGDLVLISGTVDVATEAGRVTAILSRGFPVGR